MKETLKSCNRLFCLAAALQFLSVHFFLVLVKSEVKNARHIKVFALQFTITGRHRANQRQTELQFASSEKRRKRESLFEAWLSQNCWLTTLVECQKCVELMSAISTTISASHHVITRLTLVQLGELNHLNAVSEELPVKKLI